MGTQGQVASGEVARREVCGGSSGQREDTRAHLRRVHRETKRFWEMDMSGSSLALLRSDPVELITALPHGVSTTCLFAL
jgi:hypothetical protein